MKTFIQQYIECDNDGTVVNLPLEHSFEPRSNSKGIKKIESKSTLWCTMFNQQCKSSTCLDWRLSNNYPNNKA
ncbi:MAG: hypothetical protein NXI20_28405 [bacterium]|nr:hypothetical protein [bacterium]